VNKAELIDEIADKVGITKKDVGSVLDAVIGTIRDTLSRGEKVILVGLGTFQVMQRKARRGVNPQTREIIQIPAKKVPKFVPGKSLRKAVE